MRERLSTFAVVSLITLTIWLYAEAESLGRDSIITRIDVFSSRDDVSVRPLAGFDGRVTVEFSGSKSGIARARQILDSTIRLDHSKLGLPATDGRANIPLADAIRTDDRLTRTGITIESVRPAELVVEIRALVREEVPVHASLSSVQVGGEVIVEPPTATVRLPKSVFESESSWLEIIARPLPEQLSRLPDSGPVTIPVQITLPESLRGVQGVELLTPRVTLRFSIKNTLVPATFPAPVQVLLPPIEQNEWQVVIDPDDAILDVDVSGPAEIIARLKSPTDGLIAILALSSDELASGITSKPVSFAVLRQGVAASLPDSLVLPAQPPSVKFSIRKRVTP